jgi:hypothetical protein
MTILIGDVFTVIFFPPVRYQNFRVPFLPPARKP